MAGGGAAPGRPLPGPRRDQRASRRVPAAVLGSVLVLVSLLAVGQAFLFQGFGPRPAATCTPYGDQPNPLGLTIVDENSAWCGAGLRAGGDVYVGSATSSVDLRMDGGSVTIGGNVRVGDGSSQKPVTLTVTGSTISLSTPATQILIERVPNSVASTGSVIRINGNSVIQGTVADPNAQPLGLKIKSGPAGSYRLHLVQIEDTKFRNLGNYWDYNQAALDTHLTGDKTYSSTWSKFAPSSYFTRLNFTNPTGMRGSPPADDPVAAFVGDSLPITFSEFYGGFMGVGFSKWVWNSRFHSVCRDTYDPMPGGVTQNNTYIEGNQGSGCKDIDFFRGNVRFRNNSLTFSPGGSQNFANGANADDNIVENNLWRDGSAGCAGGAVAERLRISNNTFTGGGVNAGVIVARCNASNVSGNVVTNPVYVGIAVINYPTDTVIYRGASAYGNRVSGCGESESNAVVCFHMRRHDASVVSGLDITATSNGWATEIDQVTNTLFKDVRITNAKVGLRVLSSSDLTFDSARFKSIGTREYYFYASTGITIRNPDLDLAPVRVESAGSSTLVRWRWTNLVALAEYSLTRTAGGVTEAFALTTDALGAGGLDLTNPLGGTYTYRLAFRQGADAVAPARIADLQPIGSDGGPWSLAWTAPGDDGTNGTATKYEVRYRTDGPIAEAAWYEATVYPQAWQPMPGGSREERPLSGLSPSVDHWFAIRASDDVFNWGAMSNVVLIPRSSQALTVVSLEVSSDRGTTDADTPVRLSALARDSGGGQAVVEPIWTAENGTVDRDGTYHPWAAGSWQICGSYATVSDCLGIVVVPGRIAAVLPEPQALAVVFGSSGRVALTLRDLKGNLVTDADVGWSVDPSFLGQVTPEGTFLAQGAGEGRIRIQISRGGDQWVAFVDVTVLAPGVAGDPASPDGPAMGRTALQVAAALLAGVLLAGAASGAAISAKALRRSMASRARRAAVPATAACPGCGTLVRRASRRCWRCGSAVPA